MGLIKSHGRNAWRKFVTDGVSASGVNKPDTIDIFPFVDVIDSYVTALNGAGALQGEWDASAGTFPGGGAATTGQSWIVSTAGTVDGVAFRIGDRVIAITANASTATYAGNWIRLAAALEPVVHGADSGASTANAMTIDTDYVISANGGQLVAFVVPVTNTSGAVTVAFNGGAALAVKTAAGNDPAIGGLAAGMPLYGQITNAGTWFRLLSDQASAAIQAAAEAAQAAAEAAQAAAETAAAGIVNAIKGSESVKTANYTIVAGDAGEIIVGSSATPFDFLLTDAATLGGGFQVRVFNMGVGVLTIDPDGLETINGVASIDLAQYEGATLWTDGTSWRAVTGVTSAANLNYSPLHAPAVVRSVQSRLSEGIYLDDFAGADATEKFQNYAASGESHLLIPHGVTSLDDQISMTGHHRIHGVGGEAGSVLRWTSAAAATGLLFTNDDSAEMTIVEHLGLFTEKANSGSAIKCVRTAEAGVGASVLTRTDPRAIFRNLVIKGATDVATDGWANGIEAVDLMNSLYENLTFNGYNAGTQLNPLTTAAINISGTKNPTTHTIVNCFGYNSQAFLKAAGTIEGILCANIQVVNTKRGFEWIATADDPHFGLFNSHVNCVDGGNCVFLQNINQAVICGNLFYQGTGTVGASTGITLAACDYADVFGNTFVTTGGAPVAANNVAVTNGSTKCKVHGNLFQSGSTGVLFQSTTSGCRQFDNTFDNVGSKVIDQSTGNIKSAGAYALVDLSANQSIPNATYTPMSWGTEVADSLGAWAGGAPTRMTIPAGVDFVDMDIGIVWAASGTGQRIVEVRKNGAALPQGAKVGKQAVGNSSTLLSLRHVPVVATDYFEVRVYQDSGGALNVNDDVGTYWRVVKSAYDL